MRPGIKACGGIRTWRLVSVIDLIANKVFTTKLDLRFRISLVK